MTTNSTRTRSNTGKANPRRPVRGPAVQASSPFCGDPDENVPDPFEADEHRRADVVSACRMPGHAVMERGAIEAALRASGFAGSYDHLSGGEEQRVRTLVQYRDEPLFRPHLIGSPAMIARLDALDRAAPNFAAVTRLVRRAALVSQLAGFPLRLQPMVLLGAPGVGKSRYARLLAAALGTSCDIINGSTLPDVASLTGYPPAWRGAGPGRLAKYIMTAKTSGPLLFLDEAEKLCDADVMAHPLDRLLPFLEYDTARAYQDENLQVPMAAQHAVILFACNSLDALSAPFRDRVLTVRIPDLGPAQRDAVLEAMLAEVAQDLGLPIALASRDALAPIRALGMRRCRLALTIAIGHAVESDRRFLTATDLAAAVALLSHPDRSTSIGFFPQTMVARG